MRYTILGATGEIGQYVVRDLLETTRNDEIIVAARDLSAVKELVRSLRSSRLRARSVDVTNVASTARLLKGTDVCINCVNYYSNLYVMRACLRAGCHYLDLGGLFHMTKKQLQLHRAFQKKKLLALLGCGSTPGITNIMIAHATSLFDTVRDIHIRFGGYDWTHYNQHLVLPYTVYTVFDEFTDKPAVYRDGTLQLVQPLTGKDSYHFPSPVGKKMCFYTLHSELATIPSAYKKKGLKNCSFRVCFPEDFVHDISLLIDVGLASREPLQMGASRIRPVDFFARELNRIKKPLTQSIHDLELLWIDLLGTKHGKKKALAIYCIAKNNTRWNASAGSVDTAVPPSILAQMIGEGVISERGVLAPEACVPPQHFFRELKKRGMRVKIQHQRVR